MRYNVLTTRMEYLISDTDPTDAAWEEWDPASPAIYFPLSVNPLDAKLYVKAFSQTSGWTAYQMRVMFRATISATPYAGFTPVDVMGPANKHSAYSFDPTGLFR